LVPWWALHHWGWATIGILEVDKTVTIVVEAVNTGPGTGRTLRPGEAIGVLEVDKPVLVVVEAVTTVEITKRAFGHWWRKGRAAPIDRDTFRLEQAVTPDVPVPDVGVAARVPIVEIVGSEQLVEGIVVSRVVVDDPVLARTYLE
jgi:hypothetical protein